MTKYKILAAIYFVSVLSASVANLAGVDVQKLYRIPFLSIRWIDIAIIFVIMGYIVSLTQKRHVIKESLISFLCYLYLFFEAFQLARTWQVVDSATQISHFICTCSLFIIIDLSTFKLNPDSILSFIKKLSLLGALVLIVSNTYLLYSFMKGNVVLEDLDIRVAIDVIGTSESVYTFVLTPLVYAYSLYYIQTKIKLWERVNLITAIVSIYISLVYLFQRGTLLMIIIVTLYFLFNSSEGRQLFNKVIGMAVLIAVFYFAFGNILARKGYDPIKMITRTAEFAVDIDNPSWDKGRIVSQQVSIRAWKKNIWMGVGYDELYHNYGLPENYATAHNGIVTSLFHRGIIGTSILILILILLYRNAIKVWFLTGKDKYKKNELMRLFVLVSFLWIITFMTQEALWEKYSLCIQFLYLGLINNFYQDYPALAIKTRQYNPDV